MKSVRPHHHPCVDCGVKTECPGTWEENYDGEPAVICDEVDKRGYETLCDECSETRERLDRNEVSRAEAQVEGD